MSDEQLSRDVIAQLNAGNWPDCPTCRQFRREHVLRYLGIVSHAPSFWCETCGTAFAMHLSDTPRERESDHEAIALPHVGLG